MEMKHFANALLLTIVLHFHALASGVPSASSDVCAALVTPHGYQCGVFEVTSDDGYIMSLQRISDGNISNGNGVGGKKTPVLILHGILVDGRSWLLNEPEQNLPFVLANNGYDVWVANGRGTDLSKKHLTLSPDSKEYWNWSFDEMAMYDLPALFEFVYNQTQQKIHYVGHSQGTLALLASLSEGNLSKELRSAALLSPVAFLSHMTSPIGVVAARSLLGEILNNLMGIAEFNPRGDAVKDFLKPFCLNSGIKCDSLVIEITGANCCINSSTVNLFLNTAPQSTSTKNMVHLAQIVKQGDLAKYNFGFSNLKQYGTIFPPIYDLSSISRSLPMLMSYGGQDSLADVKDVDHLLDVLKLHDVEKMFVDEYAHADFVMGYNAKDIVYDGLVSFFKRH